MTHTPPVSNVGDADEAPDLLQRYEALRSEDVFGAFLDHVPRAPVDVIDIGAGTGRDAAWFAGRGDRVEPVRALRQGGEALHGSARIDWLDDHLPQLARARSRPGRFDLVMLMAVWMHLDAAERETGMIALAELTKPGGRVCLLLRHGFEALMKKPGPSLQTGINAAGVTWTRVVLQKR